MAEQQETQDRKKGGERGKKILIGILILIIAIIALLIGIILYLLFGRNTDEEPELREVVVNEDNVEDILSDLLTTENTDAGIPMDYSMRMTFDWVFPDGASPSPDSYVGNSEANTTPMYFDIVLAEDEDHVIYRSPIVPLGGYVENITLDEDLDAGTYDCVVIYHLVDDDQNTLSTVRVTLVITVES